MRQGLVVGEHSSGVGDVLIVDGRIAEVGAVDRRARATRTRSTHATAGWVRDSWTCTRTCENPVERRPRPIESGARAGALGGYCALVAMPNTEPALDNVALVAYVLERGARTPLDIAVAGAITSGAAANRSRPWPRWRRSEFDSSPTTASACRTRR